MKAKIKNDLPELLAAVCNHKNCPGWLKDGIRDLTSDRRRACEFSPEYFSCALAGSTNHKKAGSKKVKKGGESSGGLKMERLANQLSEIMKNPLLPDSLYDVITDQLAATDTDSLRYILASLSGLQREAEDD